MTTPDTALVLRCAACGESLDAADRFCEGCGASVTAGPPPVSDEDASAAPCAECGAPASDIAPDGYCQRCGRKQPDPRDHLELVAGSLAGVTDKGRVHWRNEDAMSFSPAADGFVAVVCDGVSSTQDPQLASQAAADTARALLVRAATSTPGGLPDALVQSVVAANAAAAAIPHDQHHELGPASCTFVASVLSGRSLFTAWVGDSRAYWIGDDGLALQLTRDDSWATEQVEAGVLTEEEAMADARGHAITRWLGADAPDVVPHVTERNLETDGLLVLCSDGLWNYVPSAEDLAARIKALEDEEPLGLARGLCAFANDTGGHDNITVVVAPVVLER